MHRRILTTLALAVMVTAAAIGLTGFSSASFVAGSTSTSSVSAAADWTAPAVALTTPATAVRGTVALTATASDADSGVVSVELQRRAAGATTWITICTATRTPYSCSWDTTTATDGAHDLRARAVDRAGNAAVSSAARTTLVNLASVALISPGDTVRGDVALTVALADARVAWTTRVEATAAGTNDWRTVCTVPAGSTTCTWPTAAGANGRYDLRAVAASGAATMTSAMVRSVLVDNEAPAVTMVDPGGPLKGTVTLSATTTDAWSGVASVTYQAAPSGSSAYVALCTATTAPFSCASDTQALPYGPQLLRAVATDRAGNRTTSATVGPRLVDNTVRSIRLTDPGAALESSVTLSSTASSTAAIASVRYERALDGSTAWSEACTSTSAPWSCAWDTRKVADGRWSLRAVLTDVNGNQAVSAVVSGRTVDNTTTPLQGVDVQTTNGGTAARVDRGDTLMLAYSRRVALDSITPGWDGGALPVELHIDDVSIFGDELSVTRGGADVELGRVTISANLVALFQRQATFSATLTATTETVGGVPRTVVTVTVGDLVSGGVRTIDFASYLTWHPSATATSLGGRACATGTVNESGSADRDF